MLSTYNLFVENVTNLDDVTSADNGAAVDTQWYDKKNVFVKVSSNTGAVTVTIQGSHDKTNWTDLNSKTYTASNESDVFAFNNHYPYMRTKTSTQSNSTVNTVITGRS